MNGLFIICWCFRDSSCRFNLRQTMRCYCKQYSNIYSCWTWYVYQRYQIVMSEIICIRSVWTWMKQYNLISSEYLMNIVITLRSYIEYGLSYNICHFQSMIFKLFTFSSKYFSIKNIFVFFSSGLFTKYIC